MRPLVPFKLDPMLRLGCYPHVPCADCGKVIDFRHARIVMVDISEKEKGKGAIDSSLETLFQNTVRMILCPECFRQQYGMEPESEMVQ